MLLSSIAIMNIGDDEEDGLQDATPMSLVDLFGGLRHVSCLQQPTLKVLNFTLLVWSSFLTAQLQFQQEAFFAQFSSTITAAQGTEEMGARPYTVSPHNFYPRVETPAHSVICKAGCFSVH